MEQVFNFKRFWHLIRLQWLMYGKKNLLNLLLFSLFYAVVLALITNSSDPAFKYKIPFIIFGISFLLTGCFVFFGSFTVFQKKKTGLNFIMIPSSTFEKYLIYVPVRIIALTLIFPFWFYLVFILAVNLDNITSSLVHGHDIKWITVSMDQLKNDLTMSSEFDPRYVNLSTTTFLLTILSLILPFSLKFRTLVFVRWIVTIVLLLVPIIIFFSNFYESLDLQNKLILALPYFFYGIPFLFLLMTYCYFLLKEKEI